MYGWLIFDLSGTRLKILQIRRNTAFPLAKHKLVFSDPFARLIADPDDSDEKDRFILLGTSIDSKLIVVCHCVKTDESIRIISARKAEKPERKIYEEFRHA
jgi:hypothetical protein